MSVSPVSFLSGERTGIPLGSSATKHAELNAWVPRVLSSGDRPAAIDAVLLACMQGGNQSIEAVDDSSEFSSVKTGLMCMAVQPLSGRLGDA